eukprot:maker-scaffold336_size202805-snap-gene-1.52 protein:Tk02922 transcript:maker-scaffold336_size202805-snap-gene-1.52-mRNA-1 annotation:"unnamed protein product"
MSRRKFRFDLDILQQCVCGALAFLCLEYILNQFPTCLELWVTRSFIVFCIGLTIVLIVTLRSLRTDVDGKSVLITGCDSGHGLALAKHLNGLGFTVFAGCLLKASKGSGAQELANLGSPNLHVLELDVTDGKQWQNAIDSIREKSDSLWALVNTASWVGFGELEFAEMSIFEKSVNINVLGQIHGIKTCLPLVRKAQGRIITSTDGLSVTGQEGLSPFVLAKSGLSGVLKCLRMEMKSFGVKLSNNGFPASVCSVFVKMEAKRRRVLDLLSAGMTVKEVMDIVSCSRSLVDKVKKLRKDGKSLTRSKGSRSHNKKLNDEFLMGVACEIEASPQTSMRKMAVLAGLLAVGPRDLGLCGVKGLQDTSQEFQRPDSLRGGALGRHGRGLRREVIEIQAGHSQRESPLANHRQPQSLVERQIDRMEHNAGDEIWQSYSRARFHAMSHQIRSCLSSGVGTRSEMIESYTNALLDAFPQNQYQPMDGYFKARSLVASHLPSVIYDWIYGPQSACSSQLTQLSEHRQP